MKKYNVIDWVLILCVLFIAIGIVSKIIVKDAIYSRYQDSCYVTVKVSGVERERLEMFGIGDEAFCLESVTFGQVFSEPQSAAYVTAVYDSESNGFVSEEDPGKCDVTLVVEAKGYISESGFLLAGIYSLTPGMNIDFECGGYQGDALIVDISDKK